MAVSPCFRRVRRSWLARRALRDLPGSLTAPECRCGGRARPAPPSARAPRREVGCRDAHPLGLVLAGLLRGVAFALQLGEGDFPLLDVGLSIDERLLAGLDRPQRLGCRLLLLLDVSLQAGEGALDLGEGGLALGERSSRVLRFDSRRPRRLRRASRGPARAPRAPSTCTRDLLPPRRSFG